jgi:general secretion pathway protein A
MFLEHYGLREQPFGVTPDPRYLYFSAMHREALASLFYGIETGCGFLALIAPPGMGKTTLLLQLLERLRKSARTVFLFQTQCDSREFFRYLLTDLGVDASNQNIAHMHESLNSILLSNAQMGRRFVLVIDEAQNLKKPVLETVRLLSDFETSSSKLMQIVLCGQPPLADKLSHPHLMQLRQRVSIVSRLQPFDRAEVIHYIRHRLNVAGYAGPGLFNDDAVDQIVAHSEGIPRNINNICFNALTLGYAKRLEQIDGSTVSEVLADLDMEVLRSQSALAAPTPASASRDWSASLDSLEPTDDATYQDPYSAAPAAWMNSAEGVAADGQALSDPISMTSAVDSNSPGVVSQRDSPDLAVAGLPPEPNAAPDVTVTYLGSVRKTEVRVPRMPNRAETKVDQARKREPRRPHSGAVLRPDLNVFPSKYKTQAREWLAAPPISSASSKATDPDPSVIPISDRGQKTYSREEFCGMRIDNFRQTIKNQSLFDDSAESEEELEEEALEYLSDTSELRKMHTAGQSSVSAPSVTKESQVFQPGTKIAAPNSGRPAIPKASDGQPEPVLDEARKSETQKEWKLIDACWRASYSLSKPT